jgi:hypothetical protein
MKISRVKNLLVCSCMLCVLCLPAASAHAALPQLTVRVYDAVGVPAGEQQAAEAQAAAVLKDAGIAVVWRTCTTDCVEPLGATEVMLRLVKSPNPARALNDFADSLGYSLVDTEEGRGWLATIFVDRIHEVAGGADANSSRLFGRAIAHEIGHLLLGVSTHAARGLMRSQWTAAQLRQEAPWDWLVSRVEGHEMRRSLAAWSRQATAPIIVTAGIAAGGIAPGNADEVVR